MTYETNQLEKALLDDISTDVPKAVLDQFLSLIRESGSENERTAASTINLGARLPSVPSRTYSSNSRSKPFRLGLTACKENWWQSSQTNERFEEV